MIAHHRAIAVLTLVERGGTARSFHIDSTSIADIAPILRANIRRESDLMTDEARHYMEVGREFASHGAVNHTAFEWGRGEITSVANGDNLSFRDFLGVVVAGEHLLGFYE